MNDRGLLCITVIVYSLVVVGKADSLWLAYSYHGNWVTASALSVILKS